jgi:hypothetical protein
MEWREGAEQGGEDSHEHEVGGGKTREDKGESPEKG